VICDIQRNGNTGIGKSEPLKHALSGYWSRRLDAEHHLVYRIDGQSILIAQLRYHY
jgi:toxin YoeB